MSKIVVQVTLACDICGTILDPEKDKDQALCFRHRPVPKGTTAWTKDSQIFVPENKLRHIAEGQTVEALRGSAHTLAVVNAEGICIGWILKEDYYRCKNKLCNPRLQ
jgi:hypothetical protein